MPEFDDRTEKCIATLLPKVQEQAREFLRRLQAAGIPAKIISGTRTYAEQDALYAQGRTKPGAVVTKARGGFSNHNFGIAWDIGIFTGGTYQPESPLYAKAGAIGREMGLEWGGDWKTIVDLPHFQCKTGLTLAQLRALHNQGKPIPIPPLALPHKPAKPPHSVGSAPPVAAPPPEVIRTVVEVFLNDALQKIPALLLSGRTWVAVRPFTVVFGGEIIQAGGNPFQATVSFGGTTKEIAGQILDGVGHVKFADLNALYGLAFSFDGVLRITK